MTIKQACENFVARIDQINSECNTSMARLDANHVVKMAAIEAGYEAAEIDRAKRYAETARRAWDAVREKRSAERIRKSFNLRTPERV